MLEKNSKVQVGDYKGSRGIYNNAELDVPVTVIHTGGQVGYIKDFFGGEDGWPETASLTSKPNGEGCFVGEWLTKDLTIIE